MSFRRELQYLIQTETNKGRGGPLCAHQRGANPTDQKGLKSLEGTGGVAVCQQLLEIMVQKGDKSYTERSSERCSPGGRGH